MFLNKELVDFSQPIVVKTNGVMSFEELSNPILKPYSKNLANERKNMCFLQPKFPWTCPLPVLLTKTRRDTYGDVGDNK